MGLPLVVRVFWASALRFHIIDRGQIVVAAGVIHGNRRRFTVCAWVGRIKRCVYDLSIGGQVQRQLDLRGFARVTDGSAGNDELCKVT